MSDNKHARLDTDGTAKPKTKLVGHFRSGDCVGPGTPSVDGYELRDAHEAATCQACAHDFSTTWFEYIALEEMLQDSLETMTPG